MTKEDKDLESVVTENDTEVTAENDDLDITKPKIIKYFTTVFIIFVLFTLYCTPQVALIWFGYNFSSDIEGTVVSPFMSVVDEYAPQSTQPCVYPTLDYPYENTFSCNFTNTHSQHYCPYTYSCIENSDSITPFICQSERVSCSGICEGAILDLSLFNGNETARVMENATSIWSVYFSLPIYGFSLCLAVGLIFATWTPQLRFTNKAFITIFLIWICGLIMGLGIIIGGSIFISSTPQYLENTSVCYINGDISSKMSTIENISFGQFMLFIYLCIFVAMGFFLAALQLIAIVLSIYAPQ